MLHPAAAVLVRPVVEPEAEPDMGSSEALIGVADLLEELAAEEEGRHLLQSGIALRLLAMQVLLAAFRHVSTLHLCKAKSTASDAHATMQQQQQQQQQQQHEPVAVDESERELVQHQHDQPQQMVAGTLGQAVTPGCDFQLFSNQIKQRLLGAAGRMEDSLSALRQDSESTAVPYVWQMVYQAALAHAQTGATQEIIGGIRSCILSYSQVCCSPTGYYCTVTHVLSNAYHWTLITALLHCPFDQLSCLCTLTSLCHLPIACLCA